MATTEAPLVMESHDEFDEALNDPANQSRKVSFKENVILRTLSNGQVPRHVAVILDGNRRYAKQNGLPSHEGHKRGAVKMAQMCYYLRRIGTQEVTMYTLSVHNLKNRSPKELNNLFNAFCHVATFVWERHLQEMLEAKVCARVIGDLSLLPPNFATYAARFELLTRREDENYLMRLNFSMAYGSRHNIARVVNLLKQAVDKGIIAPKDVDHDVLTAALDVEECGAVDLLLRTSGERRLSDFMLWQTAYSLYHFCPKNLPDFNIWSFAYMLLQYQLESPLLKALMMKKPKTVFSPEKRKVIALVRNFIYEARTKTLLKFAGWTHEDVLKMKQTLTK